MAKTFGLVMGKSTSGKTTLAGTLKGRTVLLQAKLKESGAPSAQTMAKKLGRDLTVVHFDSVPSLLALKSKLDKDTTFDNVYIDGGSALTFIIGQQPDNAHAIKNKTGNSFKAYDNIKMSVIEVLEQFVSMTLDDHPHPKNVFFTLAIDVVLANGEPVDIAPVILGKASWTEFTKISPTIVTLVTKADDDGKLKRIMLTREFGPYKGRVAGVLDEDNPGFISPPDLSQLLDIIG